MKKLLALILCIASLLAVAVFPARAEEAHDIFADVEDGKWYTDAIDFVYAASIMTGTSGTCFSPNKPITREEFFFIYVKKNYVWLSNVEIPHYEKMSFTDVAPNKWYSDYIEFAYRQGITAGIGNGEFGLGRLLKREDAAVILDPGPARSGGEIEVEYWGNEMTDMDKVSDYAKAAVDRACSYQHVTYHSDVDSHDFVYDPIFSGNKNKEFMPKKSLTRAEVAVIIYNMCLPVA